MKTIGAYTSQSHRKKIPRSRRALARGSGRRDTLGARGAAWAAGFCAGLAAGRLIEGRPLDVRAGGWGLAPVPAWGLVRIFCGKGASPVGFCRAWPGTWAFWAWGFGIWGFGAWGFGAWAFGAWGFWAWAFGGCFGIWGFGAAPGLAAPGRGVDGWGVAGDRAAPGAGLGGLRSMVRPLTG